MKDLSGCPTFAGSYEFYDALGIFVNQLKLTGRHDKFMQVLKSHTGNLTPGVDLETIGRNTHAVDKIMGTLSILSKILFVSLNTFPNTTLPVHLCVRVRVRARACVYAY